MRWCKNLKKNSCDAFERHCGHLLSNAWLTVWFDSQQTLAQVLLHDPLRRPQHLHPPQQGCRHGHPAHGSVKGGWWYIMLFLIMDSPDSDWTDIQNPSSATFRRYSSPHRFPLWRSPSLCHIHLQHSLQDGSHFQGKHLYLPPLIIFFFVSDLDFLQHGPRAGVPRGSFINCDSICCCRSCHIHLWLSAA